MFVDHKDLQKIEEYKNRRKSLEEQINALEKKKDALTVKIDDLDDKVNFDRIVEGDICNVKIGDKVLILKEGKYEGEIGEIHSKDSKRLDYKGKHKDFTFYEVSLPDHMILTYHHNVLKKIES